MKDKVNVRKVKKDEKGREICLEVKLITDNEDDENIIKAILNSSKPEISSRSAMCNNSEIEIEFAF